MTPSRRLARRVCAALLFLTSLSHSLHAQSDDARITGIVTDSSKAVIRGAKVDLINVATGVHYPTVTNEAGVYRVSGQVGNYRLEIAHPGFKTVIAPNIALHTQDALQINIEMAVGSAEESVTVSANATIDNPAVSMTVDREFVENMPLNGRSFQDLIQLAPGVVSAQGGGGGGVGYYSVNGQRSDGNAFSVDGVSDNLGGFYNSPDSSRWNALAGTAPAQSIMGTTQDLASVDSLQEFTIQTSGYTAEYGRNPGGQIGLTTRSGTNELHGSAFDYLRNTAFDANSYQNDFYGYPQTAEHQNDFGGTLGGPVWIPHLYNGKDKTFFFFSYEGLRLLLPAFESNYVPTPAFRSWASVAVQPFLNAEPLPNGAANNDGCTIPNPMAGQADACDALFTYGYSYPNTLNNVSLRIDEAVGKRMHIFARYADTPSSQITGAGEIVTQAINAHTLTAGFTANITTALVEDFRFNYTNEVEDYLVSQRPLGGSVPLQRSLLIPSNYDGPDAAGTVELYIPNTSFSAGSGYQGGGSEQHQYQWIDSSTWTRGHHSLKFGVDWRRLTPSYSSVLYQSNVLLESLSAVQQGYATSVRVNASAPGRPIFDNLSLYAQDHWNVTPVFSIDYGLRWEFNPPPGPSDGHYPAVLTSSNLSIATVAPAGTPLYKSDYHSFAPRVGFAWNLIRSTAHPLTMRVGAGVFFDTGQGTASSAYAGSYPFDVSGPNEADVPLPLSAAALAPPPLNFSLGIPYPYLQGLSSPTLTLPYTEEWNLSIDEKLNAKNTLTASYVGNNGKKLLFSNYYAGIPGNPDFAGGLYFTDNASESNYNALQFQDVGRIAKGLDLVASFTWAHGRDDASGDNTGVSPLWGNSDNDIRRALNVALNYEIESAVRHRWLSALVRGWLVANRFSTQSGLPLTGIYQTEIPITNGSYAEYFPDLVPGFPIYLHGRAANVNGQPVPGSWRLNPAAFGAVPTDPNTGNPIRQGTLGRNYVRNPSFYALNTVLQRDFPVYEQCHLNFRVEAFNIFNHPNLGNPDTYLPDSTFGELIYGSTTTIGSSNQLYAMGASRSLQFSLKLQF